MRLEDARREFIQTWGSIGSNWGIPKSMAQIHALLLSHRDGLSTEDVMDTVQLSRGNVNINLRELVNWKLASKVNRIGERKEFFEAEHDIWTMAQNILRERKSREMEPVQLFLNLMKKKEIEGPDEDVKHFKKMIKDLDDFLSQLDHLSTLLLKLNNNVFFKKMIKVLQ